MKRLNRPLWAPPPCDPRAGRKPYRAARRLIESVWEDEAQTLLDAPSGQPWEETLRAFEIANAARQARRAVGERARARKRERWLVAAAALISQGAVRQLVWVIR